MDSCLLARSDIQIHLKFELGSLITITLSTPPFIINIIIIVSSSAWLYRVDPQLLQARWWLRRYLLVRQDIYIYIYIYLVRINFTI